MQKIPSKIRKVLEKQQYRIIGNHSGIKICRWTKKSLTENKVCYKELWYNIRSHRCMEFSPNVIWCNHHCLWCWRLQSGDRPNLVWKEYPFEEKRIDDPREILEQAIEARKNLLSGLKGNPKVERKKWEEAVRPTNIAISLSGEPTLYPKLSELIKESHKMGMKTFLVTNGTIPEALKKLDPLPWQLYITLSAPDKETYLKSCRPLILDGWKRLNESLELMKSFDCRTVIRLTLVKGLNMIRPKMYAKLIEKANPTFLEVKGYVWVGESQKRLSMGSMPFHEDVVEFAKELSESTGYEIKDEFKPSRVVLLAKK